MTDAPSPPSAYPLHSLEYFWERITFGSLTEEDAAALWKFVVSAAQAAGVKSVDDARAATTRVDFKKAVLDINSRSDAGEQVALALLAQGATDDAASRFEAIIGKASNEQGDKLWCKGALFAPTAPSIARDAWERLLQLRPDFHYTRCALGEILERLGDVDGAEAAYQSVVINASDDQEMQAWAVDNLGSMALRRRDLEAATCYFERSLQLYRKLKDTVLVYATLKQLALLAESRNELVLAESYLQQALQVAGEQADTEGVLSVLEAIAVTAGSRGDLATAEAVVRRAIGIHEHRGDQLGAAERYARLGELDLQRDDFAAAFTHLDHARTISQAIGDDAGAARAFHALGLIRMQDKEYGDAERYFMNAAALHEKAGNLGQSALTMENLGWTRLLRDDADAAKDQLQRALALYDRTEMHEEAQRLRQKMAEYNLG